MSKNKVIKSVSFNITNAADVESLEHVKGEVFSGYVKRLIQADIARRKRAAKIADRCEDGGFKFTVEG